MLLTVHNLLKKGAFLSIPSTYLFLNLFLLCKSYHYEDFDLKELPQHDFSLPLSTRRIPITCYAESSLFFFTDSEIVVYNLEKSQHPKEEARVSFGSIPLDELIAPIKCNHNILILVTRYGVHFLKVADDNKAIETQLYFPANYFRKGLEFLSPVSNNNLKRHMVLKGVVRLTEEELNQDDFIGEQDWEYRKSHNLEELEDLYVLDFRGLFKPKLMKLQVTQKLSDEEIDRIAERSKKKKDDIQRYFPMKISEINRIVFGDKGQLLLIFTSTSKLPFSCPDVDVDRNYKNDAFNITCNKIYMDPELQTEYEASYKDDFKAEYDSTTDKFHFFFFSDQEKKPHQVFSINGKGTSFKNPNPKNEVEAKRVDLPVGEEKTLLNMLDTGSLFLMVGFDTKMYFLPPEFFDSQSTDKTIMRSEFASDKDFRIIKLFRHSNLVLTQTPSPSSNEMTYRFLLITDSSSRLCHRSCRQTCPEPFTVCRRDLSQILLFLLSSVCVLLFLGLFRVCLTVLFQKTSKNRPKINAKFMEGLVKE